MADDNRTPQNGGSDKEPSGNNWMKSLLIWAGIILALVMFVQLMGGSSTAARDSIPYSEFLNRVEEGSVKQVVIGKEVITGRTTNNETFRTNAPAQDPALIERLRNKGVSFEAQPEAQTSLWTYLLVQSLPFLLILGIAFFVMRQMQKNAGSGAMGFGRSKAKLLTEKHGRVTFDDVAGIDEAREELQEIVEFLKDPTKFARLGGKIPKGALLVGSPGTG